MAAVASRPNPSPARVPTPNWARNSRARSWVVSALPVITPINPRVRKIAIGSLEPLYTSRVELSRSGSLRSLVRSTENTAAASVEPTMLPTKGLCSSGNWSTQAAARPVSRDVSSNLKGGERQGDTAHTEGQVVVLEADSAQPL
jgi:hypothetical protein